MNINLINRLDVFVKIIYIKSFLSKNSNSKINTILYKKHIKLFNWWLEDHKIKVEDFERDFQYLILNMQKKWFNKEYPIQINKKWELLNWAHRLACCLYFWIDPIIEKVNWKWIYWWFKWFNDNNFCTYELLDILNCYTDYNKEFFIYIIWPTLINKEREIVNDLNEVWQLIWNINIKFNKKFISELIKDIYSYDAWNINWWLWIDKKIILLSEVPKKEFKILLYNKNNVINERILKNNLREKYKIFSWVNDWTERFYTFHSWENQNENNYIKNILLNSSNLKSLNKRNNINDNSDLIKRLIKFYKYINSKNIDKENYCIVWSSILEIYWLRQARDLDFISMNICKSKSTIKINEDIEIFKYNYSNLISNKEIINYRNNYLYFRWIKYIEPKLFLKIKNNFHRKKDLKDIKLLNSLSVNNFKFSIINTFTFTIKYYKKFLITHLILKSIKLTKKIWIYKQVSYLWRKYILKNIK